METQPYSPTDSNQPTQSNPPAQLNNTFKENLILIEKNLLKIFSFILVLHGLTSLYDELVQIFLVFPQLPGIFKATGFAESTFQYIFQRSLLLVSTASLESLYGFFLIRKQQSLANRIHLISGIGLLLVSLIIQRLAGYSDSAIYSQISTPPTIGNLISPTNFFNFFGLTPL